MTKPSGSRQSQRNENPTRTDSARSEMQISRRRQMIFASVPSKERPANADEIHQIQEYWRSQHVLHKALQHSEGSLPAPQHIVQMHNAGSTASLLDARPEK